MQRLLHVRQRGGGVIGGGVIVGPCDVDVGVVGLFLREQVQVLLRVVELTTQDQQVGHVKVRRVLVRLDLYGRQQFLVGGGPLLQLHCRQCQLVVSVGET